MNNTRLEEKRAIIVANREAVKALKTLILKITDELSLDEERIQKRIDSATKSEYGSINGLINLVASIANWPAEPGDGSMVATNRALLESKFNLDLMMLEDIRAYRGYHSFVTDELEIIDGVEPAYEDYSDYCQIFLEELGCSSNKPTICKNSWNIAETKAKARAKEDLESMREELEKHQQFIASQQ